MKRSFQSSREARSHEPIMPRRSAAVAVDHHCIPTPDVLGATQPPSGSTEATSRVSPLDGGRVAFVIGRGPSHEVERTGLPRGLEG